MVIDAIIGICVLIAFFKGYKKGIIHSIMSMVGLVIGVLVALKGFVVMGAYLSEYVRIPAALLPILSFLLVFFLVIVMFKISAWLTEKTLKFISLNIVNHIFGGIVWAIIILVLSSLLLWLVDQAELFTPITLQTSYACMYLIPLAPFMMEKCGEAIPFLKNLLLAIESLFNETINHIE